MLNQVQKRIIAYLDDHRDAIISLSAKIHQNPELGFQEYFAVDQLTAALTKGGFHIEKGIAGLDTAFRAEYQGLVASAETLSVLPKIGFLAEYDALPELGHGCGHNLIGAAAVGAALALSHVMEDLAAVVVVIGGPAEETGGGKIALAEQGIFEDLSAVLMVHPADRYMVEVSSLAMDALEFTFYGKAAHAAASPHEGRNALDGVIQLFNVLNALRGSLRDEVRINGIITEGGQVANVIPAKAIARFYVRARDRAVLAGIVERVYACARGAAEATGTQVEWRNYELSYDNLVTNKTMARVFEQQLSLLGISKIATAKKGMGSLDIGNVSKIVPAIHPYIAIGPQGLIAHTPEFTQASNSSSGNEGLIIGAKALALTALEIIQKPALLQQIKAEFAGLSS